MITLILFFIFVLLGLILSKIEEILILLKKLSIPDNMAGVIEFYVDVNGVLTKVDHMFLKVSQNLPMSLVIKDAKGNPAKVDGAPAWAVSDASLGSLTVADDGLSAIFLPVGPIGSLKIQVSADADLGAGVKTILGELDLDLIAGDAVSMEIAAGEPTDA